MNETALSHIPNQKNNHRIAGERAPWCLYMKQRVTVLPKKK